MRIVGPNEKFRPEMRALRKTPSKTLDEAALFDQADAAFRRSMLLVKFSAVDGRIRSSGGYFAQAHRGVQPNANLDGSQKKMAQGGAIGGTHLAWAKKLLPRLP
jgi:hypothetical protein